MWASQSNLCTEMQNIKKWKKLRKYMVDDFNLTVFSVLEIALRLWLGYKTVNITQEMHKREIYATWSVVCAFT